MIKKTLLAIIGMLVCFISYAAEIDVVELTNGKTLKGEITMREPDGSLRITLLNGNRRYVMANEIVAVRHIDDPSIKLKKPQNINTLTKGYKGFAEIDLGVDVLEWDCPLRFDISTTHGYQFNPWLFVGAGLGYSCAHSWFDYYDWFEHNYQTIHSMLMYADIRATYPNKKSNFAPYFEQKIGYTVGHLYGFYASPSIGVHYAMSGRKGISIGFGINYQAHPVHCRYDIEYENYDFSDHYNFSPLTCSLRLGFDF